MSMKEFGDLFFVVRDVRQKAFELLRHRAKHIPWPPTLGQAFQRDLSPDYSRCANDPLSTQIRSMEESGSQR